MYARKTARLSHLIRFIGVRLWFEKALPNVLNRAKKTYTDVVPSNQPPKERTPHVQP
jgi:hypothetical protein